MKKNRSRILVIIEGPAPSNKTAIAKAFNQVIDRFDSDIGEAHVYSSNNAASFDYARDSVARDGNKEVLK